MNERPIIFSAPMVRAILDGRKTQTRRVVKPQPPSWAKYPQPVVDSGWDWTDRDTDADDLLHWPDYYKPLRCPYGVPGDRLRVRETWHTDELDLAYARAAYARAKHEDAMSGSPICYAADAVHDNAGCIWRPPIHMPRRASRITLEIVSVRVERVQEISEEDALAEGALEFDSPTTFVDHGMQSVYFPGMGYARAAFIDLWESIHGPDSWSSNPWVWVIEFRRAGE